MITSQQETSRIAPHSMLVRFYPNAFELTNNAGATPSVLDACSSSGFTYFDESAIDIDYKITAKNALGDAISNYDAASGYGVATVSIGVESTADDGVNLASRLSGATSSWSSGVYSVDSSSSQFASSGSSPNAELLANVGLIINDTLDGLNLASLDFDPGGAGDCTGSCTGKILPSSLRLRHGRLRLTGASGPETVALPAPLETQYYNGSVWIRNTLDDCTSFPNLSSLGLSPHRRCDGWQRYLDRKLHVTGILHRNVGRWNKRVGFFSAWHREYR